MVGDENKNMVLPRCQISFSIACFVLFGLRATQAADLERLIERQPKTST